jgi:predicted Holliday junction resolvase-like endonuclease
MLVLVAIVLTIGSVLGYQAWVRFRTLMSELSEYRERISILQLESTTAGVAEEAARERAEGAVVALEGLRRSHAEDREASVARIALLEGSERELSHRVAILETDLEASRAEARNQKGRANSANVSKGQLLEKWAPFVDHPQIDEHWRPEDWTFMGNPIDYIVFDWHRDTETNLTEGMVVFAEVKSAGSSLSTKQRRIRDLVRAGRVEWREVRLE